MRKRLLKLAAALSLTVSAGCDNVQWGGADVAIVHPPPKAATVAAEEASAGGEHMPQGPLLFYVTPAGTGATITPIAEVAGDVLHALRPTRDWRAYGLRFISEFMRRGAEFALFHDGARVGTFVMQSASLPQNYNCSPLPVGVGSMELAPGVPPPPALLALPKTQAPEVKNRLGPPVQSTRNMEFVAPILAERLLRARHAQLPGNWQRAMAQIQPFPVAGVADPAFTATFLVGDTLGIGPSYGTVAYSLFFIATPQGNVGYDTAYVEFRDYPKTGKGAPRVVDYLDWNHDEQVEVLAQVLGEKQAPFEAFGKHGRDFRRIFQQRCEAPGLLPPVAGAETAPAGTNAARAAEAAKAGAAATAGAAGTPGAFGAPVTATPATITPAAPRPAPPRGPKLLGKPVPSPARPPGDTGRRQ